MKRYDTDGSGALSFDEFRAALSQLNFRNRDADMLFRAYDADGNGQLNYVEFSTLLLGRKAPRAKISFQGHNQWYPQQGSKSRNTKTSIMNQLNTGY